jgi:hypothetical protein
MEAILLQKQQIKVANKTARASGAVGKNALVPRAVLDFLNPHSDRYKGWNTLDFGSGPAMLHTYMLREAGFENTHAYDFGDNWSEEMEVPVRLSNGRKRLTSKDGRHHDLIFASNVFNTHSGPAMTISALGLIRDSLRPNGVLFFNLPASPNYYWQGKEKKNELFHLIQSVFGNQPVKYRGIETNFKGKGVFTVEKHPELNFL